MIDPKHFRFYVVRPTLLSLSAAFEGAIPYSPAAENLLVGTALVESKLTWLRQRGAGPARGVFQVEPTTHDDIWENYLAFRPELASRVRSLASQRWPVPGHGDRHAELETNMAYACAIARVRYRRSPLAMPEKDDALGLARLHKAAYNTRLGDTVVGSLADARRDDSVDWFAKVVAGGEWASV